MKLTVKDGRMLYRTCNTSLPVFEVCAVTFCSSVSIDNLQNTSECAFMPDHSLISIRSDDLVTPPARSHLSREFIDSTTTLTDGIGNIVGK